MYIITPILVHTFVSYYDINMAGPTFLEKNNIISSNKLTKIPDKTKRNIEYGKLLKTLKAEQYVPWCLKTYCKLLCYLSDGILYTVDSVVTSKNVTNLSLVKSSIFTFKRSWTADLLIISKDKKSYIAFTDTEVIIKGDELPIGILKNLKKMLLRSNKDNWLLHFKTWFKNVTDATLFITNKQRLYSTEVIENINEPELFKNKTINKHFYWTKLLPYFQSIQLYYF